MTSEEKIEFYFKVLNRIDSYIQLANTKASNQITTLVTVTVAIATLVGWALDPKDFKKLATLSFTDIALIIIFLYFLWMSCKAYLICNSVIQPDLSRSKETNSLTNKSTIFFSDIDSFLNEDYVKTVKDMNIDDSLDDLLGQIHVVSYIAQKKFINYSKIGNCFKALFILVVIIVFLAFYKKTGL